MIDLLQTTGVFNKVINAFRAAFYYRSLVFTPSLLLLSEQRIHVGSIHQCPAASLSVTLLSLAPVAISD